MANAGNAKIQYEGGQTQSAMGPLENSGDNQVFESGDELWSRRGGFAPVIRPDGLRTGGEVRAGSGSDSIDVSALTCYLAGEEVSVAGETGVAVTRATTNSHIINSVTVSVAGEIAVVSGTSGTSFSETRGGAGGAPLIPFGSIEIGHVRLSSADAAPVASGDIRQVPGLHQERFDMPLRTANYRLGTVEFNAPLEPIHVGGETKGVYASYASAIFADFQKTSDFVPSEESHSLSSTQIYGTTIGSSSTTLNQSSFTTYLEDGITDPLISLKNETLWFKFYPDRNRPSHIIEQGKLGISRTFPAGDEIRASCTISVESAGESVAG